MDLDAEVLVRHFCLEEECQQVLDWFKEQGFERPDGADERIALAGELRKKSNSNFEASDWHTAMLYALCSLHCLDFSQARATMQSDEQKRETVKMVVPVLSNLSMIFLKRSGDGYNACRAADLGLERLRRMDQDTEATKLRAKLLFRRGLAKGQNKDFTEARADLREAAKLMPENREIRKALDNCKALETKQKGAPDDQWRGVLTETPTVSRWRTKLRRGWRHYRDAAGAAVGKRPYLILVLGPLLTGAITVALQAFAASWRLGAPEAVAEAQGSPAVEVAAVPAAEL